MRAKIKPEHYLLRAIRAYQKAGFVDDGRMCEAVFKNGRYDDIIIMSVLRSEWKTQES